MLHHQRTAADTLKEREREREPIDRHEVQSRVRLCGLIANQLEKLEQRGSSQKIAVCILIMVRSALRQRNAIHRSDATEEDAPAMCTHVQHSKKRERKNNVRLERGSTLVQSDADPRTSAPYARAHPFVALNLSQNTGSGQYELSEA